MRAYMRMSLSHSIFRCARSLDPCTTASPAPGSRVGAAGRHSQDVSLSLWQCSDRATHLSTDALPVSGGVVARAVPLSFSLSPHLSLPLTRRRSLSLPCTLIRPNTISLFPPRSINLSLSIFLFPSVSPTLCRLVLCSTASLSPQLGLRHTSYPAPREPIPTHVEAPTRDVGDDLRSRPNLAELPPLFPTRPDTLLPRVSQRAPHHAGAAPESSPSPQNTKTRGHVAAPTGPATRTLEMHRAHTIHPRYNARPCGNLEVATRRQERALIPVLSTPE